MKALFILFFPIILFSQHILQDDLNYQKAKESSVLLKNRGAMLPIRGIANRSMVYVADAEDSLYVFLKNYASIDLATNPLLISQYDVGIIKLNDQNAGNFMRYKSLPGIRWVVYFTGFPHDLKKHSHLWGADVLIISPPGELFNQYVGQAIFGGAEWQGSLDADINFIFRKGYGLLSDELIRLGYAPASMVGMDGDFLETKIDSIVHHGLISEAYPGAQVLVARKGKIVFHKSFGYHTYERIRAVENDDLFDYASVTKVSGSLPALIKLYGEGKFNPDKTLGDYVSSMRKSNKSELVLRRMLAHNAGLMSWIPFWRSTLKINSNYPWQDGWNSTYDNDYQFKRGTLRRDSSRLYPVVIAEDLWLHKNYLQKIYVAIKKSPVKPEQGYVYSDLTFHLMPPVIEGITKKAYTQYLEKEIYEPLGAFTIGYNPLEKFPLERIVPTEVDTFFRMRLIQGRVHDEGAAMMGGVSGNAGLFSTALDLAKLWQMYLNGGVYGGVQILKQEAIDTFARCQYCEEGNHRGMGFERPPLNPLPGQSPVAASVSDRAFGHSGYTGTYVWADPANETLLIFFSNRVYPTRDNRKLYELGIRPAIHQAIYDAIIAD
jgi:serine-type D-Ala-D-Ala carboxypeptidase